MLDPNLAVIFAFVVLALLILVGGFVLRPFAKRMGDAMDRYLSQKTREERETGQLEAVRERLESLDQRMALMEERLEFTEQLLTEKRQKEALDAGPAGREAEGAPGGGGATAGRD